MPINYYQNNKLLCKGLAGLASDSPIHDKNSFFKNTQFHSYLKDFRGLQSNWHVFFNKDYVLPYFLIII